MCTRTRIGISGIVRVRIRIRRIRGVVPTSPTRSIGATHSRRRTRRRGHHRLARRMRMGTRRRRRSIVRRLLLLLLSYPSRLLLPPCLSLTHPMLRLSLHHRNIPPSPHLPLARGQRCKLLARHAERGEEVLDVYLGLALGVLGLTGVLGWVAGLVVAWVLTWMLTGTWVGSRMSVLTAHMRWMASTWMRMGCGTWMRWLRLTRVLRLRLRVARMLLLLMLARPRMMRLSHPRMLRLEPAMLLSTMLLVQLLLAMLLLHERSGVDTHTAHAATAVHQLRRVDSAHVHVHASHAATTVHQLARIQCPREPLLLLLLHRSEHVHGGGVHSSRVHVHAHAARVHTVHVDVHPASVGVVGGRGPGSLLGEWVWVHAVVRAVP